jgi:hypothetical protein
LIGVVNSKLQGAGDVTYAVKTIYLLNLIDAMPEPIKMPATTAPSLQGKSLAEQVAILKQFTYIVEAD